MLQAFKVVLDSKICMIHAPITVPTRKGASIMRQSFRGKHYFVQSQQWEYDGFVQMIEEDRREAPQRVLVRGILFWTFDE